MSLFTGTLCQGYAFKPFTQRSLAHSQQVLVSLQRWQPPSRSFNCKQSKRHTTQATAPAETVEMDVAGAGVIKAQVQSKGLSHIHTARSGQVTAFADSDLSRSFKTLVSV